MRRRSSSMRTCAATSRSAAEFDAGDAYAAALERDTLQGYEDFLQAVPNPPQRVRAIVAARREAIDLAADFRTDTPPTPPK